MLYLKTIFGKVWESDLPPRYIPGTKTIGLVCYSLLDMYCYWWVAEREFDEHTSHGLLTLVYGASSNDKEYRKKLGL